MPISARLMSIPLRIGQLAFAAVSTPLLRTYPVATPTDGLLPIDRGWLDRFLPPCLS